jgi:hypothetical protein
VISAFRDGLHRPRAARSATRGSIPGLNLFRPPGNLYLTETISLPEQPSQLIETQRVESPRRWPRPQVHPRTHKASGHSPPPVGAHMSAKLGRGGGPESQGSNSPGGDCWHLNGNRSLGRRRQRLGGWRDRRRLGRLCRAPALEVDTVGMRVYLRAKRLGSPRPPVRTIQALLQMVRGLLSSGRGVRLFRTDKMSDPWGG